MSNSLSKSLLNAVAITFSSTSSLKGLLKNWVLSKPLCAIALPITNEALSIFAFVLAKNLPSEPLNFKGLFLIHLATTPFLMLFFLNLNGLPLPLARPLPLKPPDPFTPSSTNCQYFLALPKTNSNSTPVLLLLTL